MGRFLEELESRPMFEFVGGPMDGVNLPIDVEEHPDTLRVTFIPDSGRGVVDIYARDIVEDKFRFDHRELA